MLGLMLFTIRLSPGPTGRAGMCGIL
jgi:hypothetical protein